MAGRLEKAEPSARRPSRPVEGCLARPSPPKLETLCGCSLDRAFEVLSRLAAGLGPVWLAMQTTRVGERQQVAALEQLARSLEEHSKDAAAE
jgi:hypothetical protein